MNMALVIRSCSCSNRHRNSLQLFNPKDLLDRVAGRAVISAEVALSISRRRCWSRSRRGRRGRRSRNHSRVIVDVDEWGRSRSDFRKDSTRDVSSRCSEGGTVGVREGRDDGAGSGGLRPTCCGSTGGLGAGNNGGIAREGGRVDDVLIYESGGLGDIAAAVHARVLNGEQRAVLDSSGLVGADAYSLLEEISVPAHDEIAVEAIACGSQAPGTGAIVPTLSHSDGATLATSATYVPGAVFAEVTSASSPLVGVNNDAAVVATTTSSPAPAAPTPTPAPTDTQSYFSTDYSTSGYTVQEVLWVEELQTVTVPITTTTTAYNKRHVHKHKRRGS